MNRVNSLAIWRPLSFSLAITFLLILLVLISSIVVGRIWPADTPGWYFGSTIGRLVSILILLFMLSRLGWIHSAGFTSLGRWQTWLILLFPLEYALIMSAYAMTGILSFGFSDPLLAGLTSVFIMLHTFLEEIVFRGSILHAFVRSWGTTNRGIFMSVLMSSLFFAGYHILYLAAEPPAIVLSRIVVAFLLGILLGALVLKSGSIYPALFFHGLFNVAGYLNLTSTGTEATAFSWLLLSLSTVPLALYGLILLRDISQPVVNLDSPLSSEYSAG